MTIYREEYENLANAIIIRAVSDWRDAVRHPKGSKSRLVREETEAFFLSDWFAMLTNVDGKWLLDKLKKESGIE